MVEPIKASKHRCVVVEFDDGIEAVFEPNFNLEHHDWDKQIEGLQHFSLRDSQGETVAHYDCVLGQPGNLSEASEGWNPARIVGYWEKARKFCEGLCWGEGGPNKLAERTNYEWWYHWRVTSVGLSGIDDLRKKAGLPMISTVEYFGLTVDESLITEKDVKCSYCNTIALDPIIMTRAEFYSDVPDVALPDGKMAFCDETCKDGYKSAGWPLSVKESLNKVVESTKERLGPDWHT